MRKYYVSNKLRQKMTIETINDPSIAKEKFLSILSKNAKVMVFYYWKMCGHCVTFAPIWNKVVNQYKDRIHVINIELESMKRIDKKYMVSAFPSIIVYKNKNKWIDYTRERTEKELHKFIQENLLDNRGILKTTPKSTRVSKKPVKKQI
jgi:thiol-disulfide isomerase/thioredoxin